MTVIAKSTSHRVGGRQPVALKWLQIYDSYDCITQGINFTTLLASLQPRYGNGSSQRTILEGNNFSSIPSEALAEARMHALCWLLQGNVLPLCTDAACCTFHALIPPVKRCSSRSAVFHSHLLHVAWIPHQAKVLRCPRLSVSHDREGWPERTSLFLQLNSRLAFVLVITLVRFFYRSYKAIPIPTKNFPTFFPLHCIVTGQAERNWTRKKRARA